jgi:hypothetical protein
MVAAGTPVHRGPYRYEIMSGPSRESAYDTRNARQRRGARCAGIRLSNGSACPGAVQEAIKELGLTVTAAKDQTAEQQKPDEEACAVETVSSLDTPEIKEAKKEGGAGKGAIKGAAGGLLIGAITGDAGKGAAIGAGVGAGAIKKNRSEKDADKANTEAMTSCLSRRATA